MVDQRLGRFVEELKGLAGAFEIARACLRYAYTAWIGGQYFNNAFVDALAIGPTISGIVTGHIRSALTSDVLDQLGQAIASSDDPPLAAWWAAQSISIATDHTFTAHMTDPAAAPPEGVSVYQLEHLDAYLLHPNACLYLYGSNTHLSERAGPERDQFNPAVVGGLALWTDEPALRAFRVVVDKVGGAAFNAGLTASGLDIACIQPNRTMADLTVDWFSAPDERRDRRFFGVRPKNADKQRDIIVAGLRQAAADGAAIALLPELVTTQGDAAGLQSLLDGELATGNQLHIVVSGSFHHREGETRRNTTYVYFRDFAAGTIRKRHHQKAGRFEFAVTAEAIERLFGGDGVKSDDPQLQEYSWMIGETFREDVTAIEEIRLYSGLRFSAAVVICADFLNRTVLAILQQLRVSLLLICNMTPKIDGFDSGAQGLILSSQTTTLTVNNPALWPTRAGDAPVTGALAEMPLRGRRRLEGNFPEDSTVLVFNTSKQSFRVPGLRRGAHSNHEGDGPVS